VLSEQSRVAADDLDSPIEAWSGEVAAQALEGTGVAPGSTTEADGSTLSGEWTTRLVDEEGEAGEEVQIAFDENGAVSELRLFSDELTATAVASFPSGKATPIGGRLLGAIVRPLSDRVFEIAVVAVFDLEEDGFVSRVRFVFQFVVSLGADGLILEGVARRTTEVIATTAVDQTPGQTTEVVGTTDFSRLNSDSPSGDQSADPTPTPSPVPIERIFAQWDFETSTFAASARNVHVVASDFESHTGFPSITGLGGINFLTESGWTDPDAFLKCTLQTDPGFTIQLDEIRFDQSKLLSAGPTSWTLRSDSTDLGSGDTVVNPSFKRETVPVNIVIGTDPVEFRWIASGTSEDNQHWGLDNVTFVGQVDPSP
jgi:hypothetical protein